MGHYVGTSGLLNQPLAWWVTGVLDLDAFADAVNDLCVRHEALRTTFVRRNRHLLQQIHEPCRVPLRVNDVTAAPDPAAAALGGVIADAAELFDPTRWPIRVGVWRVAGDRYAVSVNVCHLVTDHWSSGLIGRDLVALYRRRLGHEVPLPKVRWQFADWSRWHDRPARFDALREYWRQKLDGATHVPIPAIAGNGRGAGCTDIAGAEPSLDRADLDAVRRLAIAHRTTPFTVALALLYTTLHDLTGAADLSVASLLDNRGRPEVADTVGFFINMVLLRTAIRPDDSLDSLVARTRATVHEALKHKDLPYQMLPSTVARADGRPSGSGDDYVVFQMLAPWPQTVSGDLQLEEIQLGTRSSRFGVELTLAPDGERSVVLVNSRPGIDTEWVYAVRDRYVALTRAAARAPHVPLTSLSSRA
jgi:hypothetical protein